MPAGLPISFSTLVETGRDELRKGNYRAALAAFRRARRFAAAAGDIPRLHQAALGVSSALLQMGRPKQAEEGLREIILRSDQDRTIAHACYNLASSLRRCGRLRKARLFVQRARQKSEQSLDEIACAHIHNLLGNLDLDEGKYAEAGREYEIALNLCEVAPRRDHFLLGIIKENLGYCLLLQREFRRGIRLLHQATRLSRKAGDHRGIAEARQDVAFGHLQQGRCDSALGPAREALRLAEVWKFQDIVKNTLYLLGEIHLRLGNDDWSDYYFTRLQRFYPEVPFLRQFLRGCDVIDLVTMKNPPMERSSF